MSTDSDLAVASRIREGCLVLNNSHGRGCPTRTATATNAVCRTGGSTPVPATAAARVHGCSCGTYAKRIARRLGATRACDARIDRVPTIETATETAGRVVAATAATARNNDAVGNGCSATTNIRGTAATAAVAVLAITATVPTSPGGRERRPDPTHVNVENLTRRYGNDASDTTTETSHGPVR